MNQPKSSPIKQSFHLTNSIFIVVLLSYIFDPSIFTVYFERSFLESNWGLCINLAMFSLQFIFYCGIYGTIVEIATEQQLVYSFNRFWSNVKDYWGVYVGLSILTVFIHSLCFTFVPFLNVTLFTVKGFIDLLLLAILAQYIIRKKYVRPLGLAKARVTVPLKAAGLCAVIYAAQILLMVAVKRSDGHYFLSYRVGMFFLKYVHFLTFFYLTCIILNARQDLKEKLSSQKELYLISPPSGGVINAIITMVTRFYPPVFVVLRALTPKDYTIKEFNQLIWRDRFYGSNKLVAITCFTCNSVEAYKIAKEFRKKGSKVIMGGSHVTFLADEALEFCDSVVIGDVEAVWPDIIKDFEAGTLQKKYHGVALENYYAPAHRAICQLPPKLVSKYVETGRGCKFNCSFCAIHALCGNAIRKIPIPDIVAVIKRASQQQKTFIFMDNNIYADPAYAVKLFKALKPLNIRWTGSCTIDLAKNEKALKLAKESGCMTLLVGYEISDYSLQEKMGGKFAMATNYRELTKRFKKAGISVKAHFIFGFDTDNGRSLFDLWKFCFSLFSSTTSVSCLTPFPGTKLFDDMMRENRLSNLNWRNYTINKFVFEPKLFPRALFNWLYPFVYVGFLLTTSKIGVFLLFCWMLLR